MAQLRTEDKVRMLRSLPRNKQADYILQLPSTVRVRVINELSIAETVLLLHHLDPDQIADVLRGVKHRDKIISQLSTKVKEKTEVLLRFHPLSAGALTSLDYVQVPYSATFHEVQKLLKKHELRTGRFPAVLVVNQGMLVGQLLGNELILRNKGDKIQKHVSRIPTVRYDEEQSTVLQLFKKNNHSKVAVLDENGGVLGIIYANDLLTSMQSGQSLYNFAGLGSEETMYNSVSDKVSSRYKWLIVNIFHAFLAVIVISLFESTIATAVLLAAYMPIVAGMAGNAGTQTLAVVVRGLALGHADWHTSKTFIAKEMFAGVINGLIIGTLVGIIAFLWNTTWMFGVILAVAMIINLALAGIFGAVIPLALNKLGKDPASSATIFITTLTDVFGFFVFLGLASLLYI